jgi:hypothetical protein
VNVGSPDKPLQNATKLALQMGFAKGTRASSPRFQSLSLSGHAEQTIIEGRQMGEAGGDFQLQATISKPQLLRIRSSVVELGADAA